MSKNITPYRDSSLGKKEQVTQMFDNISGNYDDLNRVISLGIDVKWRKKVVALVAEKNPENILDIATGTGDLAILMTSTLAKKIVGLDLSVGMLEVGKKKIATQNLSDKIEMVVGDSENIPFPDNYFDRVSVAFGLRNMTHKDQALSEMRRVLKPGGKLLVLEFSKVASPLQKPYDVYSFKVLPWLGQKIANDADSYRYLAESIRMHPDQETLKGMMQEVGFDQVDYFNLTAGVAALHVGVKL